MDASLNVIENDSALPNFIDAAWLSSLRKKMSVWFGQHRRDLPWRKTSDPYKVWVSEIMLQQTQVATVIDYYNRFIAAFPDIPSLANAPEEQVLRLWEGLGYYRRARQMQAAAKKMVAQHNSHFPTTPAEVLALPGIGRYTAGAILSIALGQRQPIVEANTIRVYARLSRLELDPRSRAGQDKLWDFAQAILPGEKAKFGSGELNQAMMELGSLVCLPKNPKCLLCPLHSQCPTAAEGLQDRIPVPATPKIYEERHELAIALSHNGLYLVRQCQPGQRWAGLWDFPRLDITDATVSTFGNLVIAETSQEFTTTGSFAEIAQQHLRTEYQIPTQVTGKLLSLKHGVTKYRITLTCLTAKVTSRVKGVSDTSSMRWLAPDDLETLPLSTTGRKIAQALKKVPGTSNA